MHFVVNQPTRIHRFGVSEIRYVLGFKIHNLHRIVSVIVLFLFNVHFTDIKTLNAQYDTTIPCFALW